MVMKEGMGSDGIGVFGSVSLVLRRDRGWYSPVDRMKGSLDNSPPAPDELRFRAGAGGRLEAAGCASGPTAGCDVVWSMANSIRWSDVEGRKGPERSAAVRSRPSARSQVLARGVGGWRPWIFRTGQPGRSELCHGSGQGTFDFWSLSRSIQRLRLDDTRWRLGTDLKEHDMTCRAESRHPCMMGGWNSIKRIT